MMKVLVSGAAGFIGKYTVRSLLREGHSVLALVRTGSIVEKIQGVEVLSLDLCEPRGIEKAVRGKPDVLVHLAAAIPLSHTGAGASEAAELNQRIDENVFCSCVALKTGVVYASSTSVYGTGVGEMKTEDGRTNPAGPYAVSKLRSEEVGARLFQENGLPFAALRINAPYGLGQRTKTVMTIFIERALKGLPLAYHGTGARQQDFTYAEDVASAFVAAARKGSSGVYNISGGHPISMKELAELVVASVGSQSVIAASAQADPQEGATALYSIEKARRELEWQPRVSLPDGIRILAKAQTERAR